MSIINTHNVIAVQPWTEKLQYSEFKIFKGIKDAAF